MATTKRSETNLVRRSIFTSPSKSKGSQEPVTHALQSTLEQSTIPATAYDWESDKRRSKPTDDGTMTFFWRAHTITCLVIGLCCLFYVGLIEEPSNDSNYNTKRY